MQDFNRTNPAGRGIARLFSYVGWAIAAVGLLIAAAGALSGGAGDDAGTLSRIGAAGAGIGVALFGLFSVLVAAQTRAALDTADMTREMLMLTRRRQNRAGARPGGPKANKTAKAPGASPDKAASQPAAPGPKPGVKSDPTRDDVPPMPQSPRPVAAKAADDTRGPATDRKTIPAVKPGPRAEPRLGAPTRGDEPKAGPGKGGPARPHPIFSARPPK